MISWIVRILLMISSSVTGWFVAIESPRFELVQMAVGLLLLVVFVFVLAYWPERWKHLLNRTTADK
jgi:hypothetical protein